MFRRGLFLAQSKNEFYLRRLHSLLGVIPIGAFLIVHLMVNHQATQGAEALIELQDLWNLYHSLL